MPLGHGSRRVLPRDGISVIARHGPNSPEREGPRTFPSPAGAAQRLRSGRDSEFGAIAGTWLRGLYRAARGRDPALRRESIGAELRHRPARGIQPKVIVVGPACSFVRAERAATKIRMMAITLISGKIMSTAPTLNIPSL